MPEPLFCPRLVHSWDELHERAQTIENSLKSQNKVSTLLNSIKITFKEAESKIKQDELESAYIMYYRCVIAFKRLKEQEDFKTDNRYYMDMIGKIVLTSVEQLEWLKPILMSAYERENKESVTPRSNENDSEAQLNNIKPVTQITPVNGVKQPSLNEEREFMSTIELNRILTTRKPGENTTLIIDVRSSDDFSNSQMNVEDVINIPVNELPDGLTPNSIHNTYLNNEFKHFFKKRKLYDWVILVDWFSTKVTNDPTVPIGKMMIVLMKWDLGDRYKRRPVVLEGGFDDWVSRYPLCTTNPCVSPPRIVNNYTQSTIENISFPNASELDAAFVQEDSTIGKPTIDRSTKPGYQDKKTETVNNGVKEYFVDSISKKFTEDKELDVNKTPRSKIKNGGTWEQSKNDKNVRIMNESSDSEDESRMEYLQRSRRSVLANTSSQVTHQGTKTNGDDKAVDDDHEDDDSEAFGDEDRGSEPDTNPILASVKGAESISGMKRASSTPNILKLSINEGSRPPIDRSTKPSSNDDQLNTFTMRDNYSSSEIGKGLTGLKNLGNTCYMNSIIQCLSNTEQLRKNLLLLDPRKTNSQSKTRGNIARALRGILTQLWNGEDGSVSCKELKTIVSEHRDTFRGYEQQDSHEFLTILIDWLHEDLKQPAVPNKLDGANENSGEKAWGEFTSKNNSIIRNLFYGQLKSTVCCNVCCKESITFEPFSNLSLPLPTEERCSLADCLKLYTSNEHILGWQCPGCKTSRNATKKLDITKLPPLLVIHLKRFTSDGWCRKRLTNVEFPTVLDMSDFVTGDEHRFLRYRLYAVSNHYGTMESGHYTAYCRNASSGSWYKFDDQDVTLLAGGTPKSSAAYIVFYQYIIN